MLLFSVMLILVSFMIVWKTAFCVCVCVCVCVLLILILYYYTSQCVACQDLAKISKRCSKPSKH